MECRCVAAVSERQPARYKRNAPATSDSEERGARPRSTARLRDHVAEEHTQAAEQQHAARGEREAPRGRRTRAREQSDAEDRRREPAIVEEQPGQLVQDVHEQSHGRASAAGRRTTATAASATTRNSAANPTMARSSPGQGTPRPSPVQNTPKAESMTPTANLSVFSGTRASGRRTTKPAAATSAQAASAPRLAGTSRPRPAPTAMTMNATSRPSRSTALKLASPASQARRASWLPSSAVPAANARASSCDGLNSHARRML